MNRHDKITVVGAGSWGTALAVLLSKKGSCVTLWGHNTQHVNSCVKIRENQKYLPSIQLPENIEITNNIRKSVEGSRHIVMAVPSHGLRAVFRSLVPYIESEAKILSAVKGVENETLLTMTQVMQEILVEHGTIDKVEVGVLSGPSFAKEVAAGVPTAVTIAFDSTDSAKEMQRVFGTETFRVYISQDVVGLEISASFKNVIAIAAGVCEGLGYGFNTRAALITRGLAEMKRLGVELSADAATFSGLSGLGDLVLTCTGNLSRNKEVGVKLGEGRNLQQIISEMSMVAEGVKTTKSIFDLSQRLGIEMPILEQVYNIIYKQKACSEAVRDLLARDLGAE